MGYISRFEVEIVNFKDFTSDEKEQIKEDFFDFSEIEDRYVEELFKDEQEIEFQAKWYNREHNLKTISRLHPKLKIQVFMEGEDRDDYRKIFVHNGQVQSIKAEVKIVYKEENALWK